MNEEFTNIYRIDEKEPDQKLNWGCVFWLAVAMLGAVITAAGIIHIYYFALKLFS